jgi:STAM-binding protein
MNGLLLQKLVDVIKELETLKPVVQRQIADHNRGGTVESNMNSLNGDNGTTHRIEQHTPSSYTPQVCTAFPSL